VLSLLMIPNMCLAIPGKIKEINGHEVLVEYPGEDRKVLVGDDKVKVGDYVLVQMGIVINTISEDEAKIAQEAWKKN
jgi:hydrogenase expression/formation protein HypC